ncbi:MAG: plasmid pRiA4b ORF-3 family protein [Candidatus Pacebacteria bacterium]|nr:plasmid pRiA4b ORF-3 family protein [Candidatus Paceibacterota bacterium]
MAKTDQKIYQFKITLEEIKPSIWRRIQVLEAYTFWDLHVAITDAMGWLDYHLHQFDIQNPKSGKKDEIGIPHEEYENNTLPGWKIPIASYFSLENKKANYLYDFGDSWRHKILLEKILPQEIDSQYPICIAGERACPPEDCGGVGGYENLLEIIKDKKHEEYKRKMKWLGGSYNPEKFVLQDVYFANPKERWIRAFQDPTL